MKSAKKSDFAGLVKYLTNEQSKNERVGHVTLTNCQSDGSEIAIIEVLNTQAQNKRATSDKTYHLILSLRAGEQPDDAILKAIEVRICDGLGYAEHQRVSVVHHDTDNLHVHIAINKIHPTRYTINEPFNAYHTLGQLCVKLEREFGLEQDNHEARKQGSENRAADMEHHAGIESLLGWIKRECSDQIQGVQSWAELHQVMRINELTLHKHGNGLVITDGAGVSVKASSVARDWSKAKLEQRFGKFEASTFQFGTMHSNSSRRYELKPMPSRINTVELHARYKNEQQSTNVLCKAEWAKAIDRKKRLIEDAKRSGRLKRAAIKLIKGVGPGKKIMYAATSKTLKDDIQNINKRYLKQRQDIYDKYRRLAWADWLRTKASAGDAEALDALRARDASEGLKGDTVFGKVAYKPVNSTPQQDSITKKGTIIYRVGATAVRDDGNKLNVSRGANQDGLQAALRMAMARFGERITVNGTAAFKEQIAQSAAAAKFPIIFDDPVIERRRQALLQTITAKEATYEHAPPRIDKGRTDRASNGRSRYAATGGVYKFRATGRATIPTGGCADKPNVSGIGRKPPPQSQNRLRSLSELSVVQLAGRSEVLLPSDVFGDLEQQGSEPDNGVRRDIFRAGGIAAGLAAADRYIAEREVRRLTVFDIKKHTSYNHFRDRAPAFAGLRKIDGQSLALLTHDEEIMVLPIDDATAQRLKRVAIGEVVTVTPKGAIKTKGRSR